MRVDTALCPFRADCVKKRLRAKFPLMFMGAEWVCTERGSEDPQLGLNLNAVETIFSNIILLCFPKV